MGAERGRGTGFTGSAGYRGQREHRSTHHPYKADLKKNSNIVIDQDPIMTQTLTIDEIIDREHLGQYLWAEPARQGCWPAREPPVGCGCC